MNVTVLRPGQPEAGNMSPAAFRGFQTFQEVGPGFFNLAYVLSGIYVYDWLLSLNFEWEFVTRKRKFRWPMIFYFANRYCALAAMIAIIIGVDIKTLGRINCTALFIFIQLSAAAAVGLASINLSIRTIAIWSSNKYIVAGLILAIIGQWCLILQVGQLKAQSYIVEDVGVLCFTQNSDRQLLFTFIYAMCFDLTVSLLTSYKLFVLNPSKMLGKSRLAQIIFVDGLSFFMITFATNLVTTIFIILYPNPVVIFSAPAAVFCTIAACRAVRQVENCES